jgi:uncharacterized membrane protein YbhN (UPF0104 family)
MNWRRLLRWAVIVAVIAAFANLVGWDIRGWLNDLWDTITTIDPAYLAGGIALMLVQTNAAAYAWYSILKYGFPDRVLAKDIFAAYAVSVALNNVLPANLGTLVMLIMFTTLIAGASFAGVLGGYAVQKIFFTVAGAFVYLYLFLTVGGSFDIGFGWIKDKPVATIIVFGGGALLIVMLVRRFWPRVVAWWDKAKEGGAVLAQPRAYFGRVFLPSFISWAAMLGGIAVFLAAYAIPVTFDTVMHVAGGNSLANVTSVTPGGVGVTQAWNVASLKGVATTDQATAYSVAKQLISTSWNIIFALIMLIWAWGWGGGKTLISKSYDDAKKKQAEQQEKRKQQKEQKEALAG